MEEEIKGCENIQLETQLQTVNRQFNVLSITVLPEDLLELKII